MDGSSARQDESEISCARKQGSYRRLHTYILPKGQSEIKRLLLAKNRAIKALKRVVSAVDLNTSKVWKSEFIMILKKKQQQKTETHWLPLEVAGALTLDSKNQKMKTQVSILPFLYLNFRVIKYWWGKVLFLEESKLIHTKGITEFDNTWAPWAFFTNSGKRYVIQQEAHGNSQLWMLVTVIML